MAASAAGCASTDALRSTAKAVYYLEWREDGRRRCEARENKLRKYTSLRASDVMSAPELWEMFASRQISIRYP